MKNYNLSSNHKALNALNEPLSVYIKHLNNHDSSRIFKNGLSFKDFLNDKILVIEAIKKGFPYNLFDVIKNLSPFSDNDWADYLELSTKSLQRYRDDKSFYFKPMHTEKIIELAEVTHFGLSVFDDQKQFYSWLNMPSLALHNNKPISLLSNSYGKELVMAELNRIEYGIFA